MDGSHRARGLNFFTISFSPYEIHLIPSDFEAELYFELPKAFSIARPLLSLAEARSFPSTSS